MLDPFNASSKNVPEPSQKQPLPENTHIRTMRDDLSGLQKTGGINDVSVETIKNNGPEVESRKDTSFSSDVNNNPFGATSKMPSPAQPLNQPETIETPPSENKGSSRITRIALLIFGILFVTALVGAGVYYFIKTKTVPLDKNQQTNTISEEQDIVIIDPEEKYSANKPNYLPIDIATIATDEIWNTIGAVASELKNKPIGSIYEFMVVDSNNNAVAFPIFATATKLELSPSILANLAEEFSLFLFNDGEIRLSIATKANDITAVATDILKHEPTLVSAMEPIFLGSAITTNDIGFNSGSYGDASVRYANIDSEKNLSLDYTLSDNNLVIATSKNTMHATLDKINNRASEEDRETVPDEELEEYEEAEDGEDIATEALVVEDIQSDAGSDQPTAEFLEKFKNCEPAIYDEKGAMGSSYTYKIVGPESGRCEITTFYPTNPDPNWTNKEMTCLYDNTKSFEESIREVENAFLDNSSLNCSGPLFNLMKGI